MTAEAETAEPALPDPAGPAREGRGAGVLGGLGGLGRPSVLSLLGVLRGVFSAALKGWRGVVVISFLATVLGWRPYAWHRVYAGIDPSWEAGLTMGFMRHLQWGPELIFTYGPWGFVDGIYPLYRLTAFLSVVYALVIIWGLAALLVSALRPAWGLLLAGVAAWAAISIAPSRTGFTDIAAATALGLALAALAAAGPTARVADQAGGVADQAAGVADQEPGVADLEGVEGVEGVESDQAAGGAGQAHPRQDARGLVLLGLLGAFAGFGLLTKTNEGLLGVALLAMVVALGDFGWRSPTWKWPVLVGVVPMVVAFLAGWLGAGQSIGNIPSYFRGSLSVALGYSSAMQVTAGRGAENWYAVGACALVLALFALSVKEKPWRYRAAVLLIMAGWLWAALKEGFVRHDTHDLTFFGLALVAVLLARLPRRYVPLQVGAFGATVAFFFLAYGGVPVQVHSPGATSSAFFDDVGEVVGSPGFGQAQKTALVQFLSTGDGLSPGLLSVFAGHTVAIEPVENSVAYDYPEIDWDPLPVLQSYSAYTSYLDRLDAAFLASARAPDLIFYAPAVVIDSRYEWFDPPAMLESMYCHYAQILVSGPAQVLKRVGDRCGRAVEVGRARGHFGEAVAVPKVPGKMVVATFSFGTPLSTRLDGVFMKPPPMYVSVWTGGPQPAGYRFIPGTAADDHVVSVPPALGYSPAFTPPSITQLALSGGGTKVGQGEVTVTFYSVALGPP